MRTFLADLALHDFPLMPMVRILRDDGYVRATLANGLTIEDTDVTFGIFRMIVEAQEREDRRWQRGVAHERAATFGAHGLMGYEARAWERERSCQGTIAIVSGQGFGLPGELDVAIEHIASMAIWPTPARTGYRMQWIVSGGNSELSAHASGGDRPLTVRTMGPGAMPSLPRKAADSE